MNPYHNCKVLGPYERKDGRQHVCVQIMGKWKTISYPKFLMEQKLGRYLKDNETVDHIDGNKQNNKEYNFQILSRKKNIQKSIKHRNLNKQEFTCPHCYKIFYLEGKKLSWATDNRKRGKAGPFCGRSCSGKYGSNIRENRTVKIQIKLIPPIYY